MHLLLFGIRLLSCHLSIKQAALCAYENTNSSKKPSEGVVRRHFSSKPLRCVAVDQTEFDQILSKKYFLTKEVPITVCTTKKTDYVPYIPVYGIRMYIYGSNMPYYGNVFSSRELNPLSADMEYTPPVITLWLHWMAVTPDKF